MTLNIAVSNIESIIYEVAEEDEKIIWLEIQKSISERIPFSKEKFLLFREKILSSIILDFFDDLEKATFKINSFLDKIESYLKLS